MNAPLRARFLQSAVRLALAAGVGASVACQNLPRAPGAVLLDPQLGPAEQTYSLQSFGDSPGGLRLGAGWYAPEKDWGPGHSGVAWAEHRAHLYFGTPDTPEADFVALAVPLIYPGSPPQTVTPVLNEHWLPTVALPDSWSEIRFPLPKELLKPTVNVLRLRFDHEVVPAKLNHGTDDRTLAAAFDEIAIVPRGEPLSPAGGRSTAQGSGRDGRKLVLEREPIALPLPPATRYEIRMGAAHGAGLEAGERLAIDFEAIDGPRRRVWEGPADEIAWRRLNVTARLPRAARLRLTLGSSPGHPRAALQPVELEVPEVRALPHRERATGPPDVFLYLIDTLRADAVGVYGARRPTTPRIDQFSEDALVFTQARSPAPWTLPATTSILSGLYPSRHGVVIAGDRLAEDRAPWIPTLLSRMGYQTIGVSQWLLGGDNFGLSRGFERFYVNVHQNGKTRSANLRWFLWRHLLAPGHAARPLFAYLHSVDPHALYRPERRDRRFADDQPGTLPVDLYDPSLFMLRGLGKNRADVEHLRALYDGEVHAADRQFGAFLAQLRFLDLYDESLIILVGDHGEEFNEHGAFDHGRTLYDELLRVPLIVKLPRSWGLAGRVDTPVSTLAIAPTIWEVAGGRTAGKGGMGFESESLIATRRRGDGPRGALPLFAETHVDPVNLRAALLGTVKCIASSNGIDKDSRPAPRFQAFDLAHDPRERTPLPPSGRGVEACRRQLEAWLANPTAPRIERPLAPEDRAKLLALGYIR